MKPYTIFSFLFTISLLSSPATAQKPELTVPTGHGNPIFFLKFSPDDKYIASGDQMTIKLWDIKENKEIRTFIGWSFDFSSDGQLIAIGNLDGSINVYNIESGIIKKSFIGSSDQINDIHFTNDDKYLLAASLSSINLWDLDGNKIKSFPGMWYAKIFLKQNLCIGVNLDTMITTWSIDDIQPINSYCKHLFNPIMGRMTFSKDGSNFSSMCTSDSLLRIYDHKYGVELFCLNKGIKHINVSFSNDNKLFTLTNGTDSVYIYELKSGKEIKRFINPSGIANAVFSNDCKYVATGDWDRNIKIWDIKNGSVFKTLKGHSFFALDINVSPKLEFLLFNNNFSMTKLMEISKENKIRIYCDSIEGYPIRYSYCEKTNQCAVFNDNCINIWDINTHKMINKINLSIVPEYNTLNVIFSINGEHLIYYKNNSFTALRSLDFKKEYEINTQKIISDIKFTSDSKAILCGFIDGTFSKYRLTDGKEIVQFGKESEITETKKRIETILNDENMICYYDSTIEIWNHETGKLIKNNTLTNEYINNVTFSIDSKYLAVATDNAVINIWDIMLNQKLKELNGHKGPIESLSFSKDGRNLLFSGSLDCNIKIWDIITGKELVSIIPLDSTDWAVVAPDGRFDASPNGMKLLYYVQGLDVLPLESFYEKYYTPGLLKQVLSNPDNQTEQRGPIDFRKTLRLPPKVAISSSINEMSTDQTQARIYLQINDAGGGIDEVRLYQNGKLLPRELIIDKKTTQIGRKQEITYSVPLVAGKNEFKATGFNIDRTESIPVNLVVNRNAVESSINLYLISIGINTYKNAVYNLTYAKPDAESFVQKVEQYSSELFKKIIKYEFYDNQATRANIEDAIIKITAEAKPEDVFVFYFAGHGVMSEEEDGLPAEFYLIPHDVVKMYGRNDLLSTKGLSASWLKDNCAKIKAQKQLLLLDACHSGGAVESFAMLRDAATEKAILQLARSAGITLLAASGTEQSAAEFGQLGHGVFTFALLEGLDGLADGKKDGKVTVKELTAYIEDRVPALTLQYRGVEQYPNSYGRGQDFPIGVVKK